MMRKVKNHGHEQNDYNYNHFQPELLKTSGKREHLPSVGAKFPFDMSVFRDDGKRCDLSELIGRRFILETASLTSPHYVANIPQMVNLRQKFHRIKFAVLYVREEHPGEWLDAPTYIEDKLHRASTLRSIEGEERQVFVDTLEGDCHQKLGCLPNAVFVVNPVGTIEMVQHWCDPVKLDLYLSGLVPSPLDDWPELVEPRRVRLMTTLRVLARSGPRAMFEALRAWPYVRQLRKQQKSGIHHRFRMMP